VRFPENSLAVRTIQGAYAVIEKYYLERWPDLALAIRTIQEA